MANNKKISQLNSLASATSNDVFPIVHTNVLETKKISKGNLFASPGPIGTTSPSTAAFTVITMGAAVNEFSIDGTLVGNSDTAVPTEQAVKTYVDAAIDGLAPDKIWSNDSYVKVVDDGTSTGYVEIVIDGSQQINVESNGLKLQSGVAINEFSTDGTLIGNSDTVVPTERAVKTYVDVAINTSTINIVNTNTDTTAIIGDAVLVDTTGGDVEIEIIPTGIGKIIVYKNSTDSNDVVITPAPGSVLDHGAGTTIDFSYSSKEFLCDGTNFYTI